MAVMHATNAMIGLDVIRTGGLYRLWIDKGGGKYRSLDITHGDLQELMAMLGGVVAGSHNKPPRAKPPNRKRNPEVA